MTNHTRLHLVHNQTIEVTSVVILLNFVFWEKLGNCKILESISVGIFIFTTKNIPVIYQNCIMSNFKYAIYSISARNATISANINRDCSPYSTHDSNVTETGQFQHNPYRHCRFVGHIM